MPHVWTNWDQKSPTGVDVQRAQHTLTHNTHLLRLRAILISPGPLPTQWYYSARLHIIPTYCSHTHTHTEQYSHRHTHTHTNSSTYKYAKGVKMTDFLWCMDFLERIFRWFSHRTGQEMCSFQTTTFRVVAPRGKTVSRITKASPQKKIS